MIKIATITLMVGLFFSSCEWIKPHETSKKLNLEKPKLVVALVIDQCRSDALTRFAQAFQGGFKTLRERGAYYPFAEFEVLQSMTCPGHATVLTGAYPQHMGIALNLWYSKKLNRKIYCVEDAERALVAGRGLIKDRGYSSKRLLSSTFGDELKLAGFQSQVVSVALKDRSAIMLGGHLADAAFWFDRSEQEWVSSTQYMQKLPEWVTAINAKIKSMPEYRWTVRDGELGLRQFGETPTGRVDLKNGIEKKTLGTPFGTYLTTEMAIAALKNSRLGLGKATDLLTVSYSAHDILGHKKGPNSVAMQDFVLHEDLSLGRLFAAIDNQVGLENTLVVLTGDHGVAPAVPHAKELGYPAGEIDVAKLVKKVNRSLGFEVIAAFQSLNFYMNEKAVRDSGLKREVVIKKVKAELLKANGVRYVLTQGEIRSGAVPATLTGRQARRSFREDQHGDWILVPKDFWVPKAAFAMHITGYSYDRTVPLVMMSPQVKPGQYATKARIVDIAPTLSYLLGVVPPSGSEGRVLHEIIR